jgi:splicing factor 3B subunit 1
VQVRLGASGGFDDDLYGDDRSNYAQALDDEEQPDVLQTRMAAQRASASITAPRELLNDVPGDDSNPDPFAATRRPTIESRQSEYHQRRQRIISPERVDPFAASDKTPAESARSYADVLREQELERERQAVLRAIAQKRKEAEEKAREESSNGVAAAGGVAPDATPIVDSGSRKKRRWDVTPAASNDDEPAPGKAAVSEWSVPDSAPSTVDVGRSRCVLPCVHTRARDAGLH